MLLKTKKLLIAPLDWGLGHATRCVPIIRCALSLQIPVVLAAAGRPKTFLQNEFPNLEIIDFEGYNIHYPKTGNMNLSMIEQSPKILEKIKKEHRELEKIIETHNIGAVVSDNRYGLYNEKIYSVFMTHQLNIQAGGWSLVEKMLKKINHRYINNFNELWIPDFAGEENLAGKLSHPPLKTVPTFYLGALSRFSEVEKSDETFPEIVVLISGPEPQRTLFEEKILSQLTETEKSALVVCGTPEKPNREKITEKIEKAGHLETEVLAKQIANAKLIIARPGYSTLMDLAVFGKNALLVPTAGQTEQEFLAQQLTTNKQCYSVSQQAMNLKEDILKTESFSGLPKCTTDATVIETRLMEIKAHL